MKQVIVFRTGPTGAMLKLKITAPDDKQMAFDPALLQHGILSIGEYGASGIKVAAFNDWDHALFLDPDGSGYVIEAEGV